MVGTEIGGVRKVTSGTGDVNQTTLVADPLSEGFVRVTTVLRRFTTAAERVEEHRDAHPSATLMGG